MPYTLQIIYTYSSPPGSSCSSLAFGLQNLLNHCSFTISFWPDWHPWNAELSCTALLVHQFLLQHIILWDSLAHTSAVQKPGWQFAITLLLEKNVCVHILYMWYLLHMRCTHIYMWYLLHMRYTHIFFKDPGDHYYPMTTICTFGLPCILQHH